MSYTLTDWEGVLVVRAELESFEDYQTLIQKLLEKRDERFLYPLKEEARAR